MKEYDRVKLTVEKEKYAKYGAHKDMVGWICDERVIDEQRLVCFDECDLEDFPILPIKECDLEVVWESHKRQIGDKIILLSEEYQHLGLHKGSKGVLRTQLDNNKWVADFNEQLRSIEATINNNDFVLD